MGSLEHVNKAKTWPVSCQPPPPSLQTPVSVRYGPPGLRAYGLGGPSVNNHLTTGMDYWTDLFHFYGL